MNDRNFAVPPPGKPAMAFAWILGAGFPLGIAVLLVTMARDGAIPPLLVLAGQALVAATVLLLKSNGYALPGFHSGHFRLRDWKRRAFCLVTDPSKVLALPHADGRVWLLSFEHPQAVLDILRRAK